MPRKAITIFFCRILNRARFCRVGRSAIVDLTRISRVTKRESKLAWTSGEKKVLLLSLLSALFAVALNLLDLCISPTILSHCISSRLSEWGYQHREEKAKYSAQIYYLDRQSSDLTAAKDIRIFGLRSWLDELYAKSMAANVAQDSEGIDPERFKVCLEKAGLAKKAEVLGAEIGHPMPQLEQLGGEGMEVRHSGRHETDTRFCCEMVR